MKQSKVRRELSCFSDERSRKDCSEETCGEYVFACAHLAALACTFLFAFYV